MRLWRYLTPLTLLAVAAVLACGVPAASAVSPGHAAAGPMRGGTAAAQSGCPSGSVTLTSGVYGGDDDPGADVCVPAGNNVTLAGGESWNTLTVIGLLGIGVENPCAPPPIGVTLANGGAVASGGVLTLESSSSCFEGGDTSLTITAGAFSNGGTIASVHANGGHRTITGNLTNTSTGTVSIQGDTLTVNGPGLFDNGGTVSISGNNSNLVIQSGENFTNDTGGAIDADVTGGVPNQLQMNGGTFIQGAGTISPTALDGVTPNPQPVLLTNAGLDYTGSGSGSITFGGTGPLSGNLSPGQALIISGGAVCGATANAQISSDVANAGSITLSGVPGCQPGSSGEITVSSGTLTNSGTLTMAGNGASSITSPCSGGCLLSGTIVNTGAVNVNAPVTLSGPGTFDNQGPITIMDGQNMTVAGAGAGQGLTFVNDAGGSIVTTGDGSSGQLQMQGGNTFEQGNGTITGIAPLLVGDTLDYIGTGASHLDVQGATTLSGNIAAQQTLELQNSGGFCQWPTPAVTAATGFTNAGTILTTACNGAPTLTVISGTLLNTGQIVSSAGLVLHATVANRGTIQTNYQTTVSIDALTNYSASAHALVGGTYILNPPSTLVVPGMDIQTNGATIYLGGGSQLSDGGTNSLQGLTRNVKFLALADEASLTTGALTNAGQISLGSNDTWQVNGAYTQTATGILTSTIAGTGAGSTYGQLRVSGQATFGGSLEVITGTGYTPAAGDAQQVVTFGSRSGQFGRVTGTSAGSGLHFVLEYDPNAATFVVRATTLAVHPAFGPPGQAVTITGTSFSPGEAVHIVFIDPVTHHRTALTSATADSSGSFSIGETIPSTASAGKRIIQATGGTSFVGVIRRFTVT